MILSDSFKRVHNYLRISVTDRCNLRCTYCMPEQGIDLTAKEHVMTLEEIIAISKEFVDLGVNTIRLTGGEPLVRKNIAFVFKELAKLPITLKITTNGILLDKFYDLFEEIGLRQINISLDTLDQAKSVFITKRDYFDRILANIEEGLKRGFQIKLNVVLIRGMNEQEIPDFIALTKRPGLSVKFIEFMPFQGNNWDWSKGISEAELLNQVAETYAFEALEIPKHSTSKVFRVNGFSSNFGIVSTVTSPFCGGCNRLRLTVDGKLKTCLFGRKEYDLLTPFRKGVLLKDTIDSALQEKKFSRDGMDVFTPDEYEQNRSMIAIGG